MLKLENYNRNSRDYNLAITILKNITLSDDIETQNREKLFIKDISNRVSKSKTVLYLLKNSVTSINEQPSLQIDYIFVSNLYRGKSMKILDNCKPFRYLIEFVINMAKKIQTDVGLRYIILSPDNDELKEKYNKVDFQHLNREWMYMKI